MRISWVTDDRNAPSVVEYGKSRGNYTVSTTGNHATYRYFFYKSGAIHLVTIGPLAASTTYHYRFHKDHRSAHLSVFREASFGHGRLRIVNETSAVWTWHRNDDEYATVRDEVWLESLATPKLSTATAGRQDDEL
ncbi:Purple acid phosphatase 22 [Triticum urartu]|uniref:Purple acid phosphatase 22 n=1 Tax=Triticum urartu TaxID=4572 RepID=M8AT23_TRIUA|nr:Purple acid phosphatase 22 [Triticum urartu]